jgi:phosphate transport system substrate-binding protein
MTTPVEKCLLVIFFCSLPWLAHAKNSNKQSVDIPVKKIIWTGCGITKKAFMFEIAKAYKKKYGVTIELRGGGATKGIRSTKAGTSHIGGTCRIPMQTREESSELFKMILVAWDALVVIVNKGSPISGIKKNELVDVLNGKIKYWNELSDWQGKSNPKQTIHLYTRRSKISGVGYTLRRILFNDNEKEITSYKYFPSSGPLEKAVEKDTVAFDITGLSCARKRHVKVL